MCIASLIHWSIRFITGSYCLDCELIQIKRSYRLNSISSYKLWLSELSSGLHDTRAELYQIRQIVIFTVQRNTYFRFLSVLNTNKVLSTICTDLTCCLLVMICIMLWHFRNCCCYFCQYCYCYYCYITRRVQFSDVVNIVDRSRRNAVGTSMSCSEFLITSAKPSPTKLIHQSAVT